MGIQKDRELVDELCEIDHGLSEWELDFVEDIASQVHDDKRPLSPGQLVKALEIKKDKG